MTVACERHRNGDGEAEIRLDKTKKPWSAAYSRQRGNTTVPSGSGLPLLSVHRPAPPL
ncbi:hypothetical protein BN874_1420004 [Candidatus Contendobacter odensis Run_B_J11]|uniref:Uncharacterized protein n=1 Tax=Candidatus Contendobacter odensis Run_B_J11 TaxID=1400861 RepID=A0A7U7J2D5_9GAMM|nr:hypothetical protein BN874_1420004 [Candidatus Contendobacter odensis Run_B_J11]